MVQLIIGRAGSGKTTRLLELVRERASQGRTGQIFLVPEQFSLNAERALCRVCGNSISLSAEVLTFKSLATRVFDALGGGLASMLDEGGKLLAMYLAVKNTEEHLKVYREAAPKPEFLKNLVTLSDEFKSYHVDVGELMALSDGDSILSNKLNDVALICGAYDALRIGDLRDPADRLGAMCAALDAGDFFRGRCVCIDGFNGFTGAELEVIRRMACSADEVDIALCADGVTDEDGGFGPFSHVKKTIRALQKLCADTDVECRISADPMNCRRFDPKAGDLAQVESDLFRYEAPPRTENPDGSVRLYEAPGIYEECEAAAAEIRRLLLRGYRFRDVAVVTRDMAHYGSTLESVFARYGIAAFSDRRNDVSQKLPVRLLVTALEIAANGCALNRMLRLVKTGLAGITEEEADELEAYTVMWNVKGSVWLSEEGFTGNPDGYGVPMNEARTQRLARLNGLRRRIASPLDRLIRGCDGQTARKRVEALYRYTEDLGLADALERRAASLESDDPRAGADYRQLWEMICDCMDQFVLILGDKPLKNSEFFELFRLLITQYNVGVLPTGADTVSVGDAVRMRADHPKAVFVLGTTDGVFPPTVSDGGILTQADRKALAKQQINLAPSNEDLVAWEQLIAYQTFSAPSEYLWVSWPKEQGGENAQPSYLAERLKTILPNVQVADGTALCGENRTYARSACEELAASTLRSGQSESTLSCALAARAALETLGTASRDVLARAGSAKAPREPAISPEAAAALSGADPILMPTAVEQFHRCRFSHFASHRLKVRKQKKADFSYMEVGTFMHYVLEKTVGDVMAQGGFTGDREELERFIRQRAKLHIEDYIEENLGGRSRQTPRMRYALDRLTDTSIRILSVMIDEFAASSFIPVAFEKNLSADGPMQFDVGNGTVRLGGTVDRIDLWEYQGQKYVRVVDYKSGKKEFKLAEVDQGVSIQLLVYLFAVAAGDDSMKPAGMMYKPIGTRYMDRKPGTSEDSVADNRRTQTRGTGLILDNETVIRAMEHVPEDQRERFIPVKIEQGEIKQRGSSLATEHEFAVLRGHIARLLRETRDELRGGSILCDPDRTTCDTCDYRHLCRFDPSNGYDRPREDRGISGTNFFTVHEEDAWEEAERS